VVIFAVGFEVAVQFVDAGGQQCNLHFRGAGVFLPRALSAMIAALLMFSTVMIFTFNMRCAESNPAHRDYNKTRSERPDPEV
jgi:hypothetical protein